MSKYKITFRHQHTKSYAKKALPAVIICAGLANHIHIAGVGLSILAVGVYLFLLIIDIVTKRIDYIAGVMRTVGGIRIKNIVYLWILYGIIQTIFVILIKTDINIVSELLSYVVNLTLMLSMIRFTENDEDLKRYAFIILLCTVVELLICHYEIATGNHVRETTFRHYNMIFGTYYNENDLSVMLALGSLTALYYGTFIKEKKITRFLAISVIIADCFYMILYTRSRGGLLGFIVVAAMVLISIIFGRKYNLYRTTYRVLAIAAVFLVLIALISGEIAVTDENDIARMLIYKSAFEQFRENPILLITGLGAGQLRSNTGFAIHNYIFQVFGDFGVVGIICYLYILLKMLKWPNLYNATIINSIRKTCVIACALLMIFFGFVVSDFGSIKLSWIIMGLFIADSLASLKANKGQEGEYE